jgi:lysophospholipase L1-like esterase
MSVSGIRLAKCLPLPVFLALALALSFPGPAAAQNEGEPFDPRTIVFIGSSMIDFWKTLPQDFAGEKVINLGVAGTTYSHLVAHAGEWAVKYPADRYVIYSGDNDIAWLGSPEKVARQFREVADTLRAALPEVHILVISIKPSLIPTRRIHIGSVRKANAMLAAEAAAIGHATYVDVHTPMLGPKGNPRAELFAIDGIHMNEKGYRIWREVLRPLLNPPPVEAVTLVARPG